MHHPFVLFPHRRAQLTDHHRLDLPPFAAHQGDHRPICAEKQALRPRLDGGGFPLQPFHAGSLAAHIRLPSRFGVAPGGRFTDGYLQHKGQFLRRFFKRHPTGKAHQTFVRMRGQPPADQSQFFIQGGKSLAHIVGRPHSRVGGGSSRLRGFVIREALTYPASG